MTHWTDELPPQACSDALRWCRTQPDLETAWLICDRGDWMLWLAGRLVGPPGDATRRPLILAGCDCAELSAHLATTEGQIAIALALTIARDHARGGESTIEDCCIVAAAAYAAYADAYAYADAAAAASASASASDAASVADAAYAAADVAASVAAYAAAADAAAYAGVEKSLALRACADIVRGYYPEPPTHRRRR